MGSMNDFFVRKVTDDAITAVHAKFSLAEVMTNSEYIRVLQATLQEQELMELSLRLETDVMWLSYHSITDWFEYYHWHTGKLVRALVYAEITWEHVEGQSEAWERQFFFTPDRLAFHLDDEEEDEEDKLSEEEKQRLEQFWQTSELVRGEHIPIFGVQRCAFYVATYYRFPGWEFEQP